MKSRASGRYCSHYFTMSDAKGINWSCTMFVQLFANCSRDVRNFLWPLTNRKHVIGFTSFFHPFLPLSKSNWLHFHYSTTVLREYLLAFCFSWLPATLYRSRHHHRFSSICSRLLFYLEENLRFSRLDVHLVISCLLLMLIVTGLALLMPSSIFHSSLSHIVKFYLVL